MPWNILCCWHLKKLFFSGRLLQICFSTDKIHKITLKSWEATLAFLYSPCHTEFMWVFKQCVTHSRWVSLKMARLCPKSQQELLDLASLLHHNYFLKLQLHFQGRRRNTLTVTITQMSKSFYHTLKIIIGLQKRQGKRKIICKKKCLTAFLWTY